MKLEFDTPKEKCPDASWRLMKEGYLYIPNRIRKYNSLLLVTRLMGKKVTCISGKRAAEQYCNQNFFSREGVKVSLDFLINDLEYEVPMQDLSYRLSRIPAIPESRFIMTNIRKKPYAHDLS